MSFADELRKPNTSVKNYEWEDRRAAQCLGAVEDACLENKNLGMNCVKGYFYCDDSDYGTYRIVNQPVSYFEYRDASWDYLKKKIARGLADLGFTDYAVEIRSEEMKRIVGTTIFGKPKMASTGQIGHTVYIEVSW